MARRAFIMSVLSARQAGVIFVFTGTRGYELPSCPSLPRGVVLLSEFTPLRKFCLVTFRNPAIT